MEPILSPQTPTADLRLAATIKALEAECASGWSQPEPADLPVERSVSPDDHPVLIGSVWDRWSSNPFLDRQQVEEQPGS